MMHLNRNHLAIIMLPLFASFAACSPPVVQVQVQAPEKPIEINLNIKIEQRVKIEIEKDVQKAIAKNKAIF
jgi:hypothetical protein